MSDEPLSPACAPCRWGKGTCFPGPCLIYRNRMAVKLADALTNLERYLRDTPHHNAIEAAAARKVLRQWGGVEDEPFDLRNSPQYHPGDLA